MPTLILPPRFTDDTNLVRKAAIAAGWSIERLPSWRVPDHIRSLADLVLYGEPLFAAVVADALDLSLLEPPFNWLTTIPTQYLHREIQFTTLKDARDVSVRSFFKPADDKCFRAQVYQSGRDLPTTETLPASTPVLISAPVEWDIEFRCFVLDRELQTLSPYSRSGELAQDDNGNWPVVDDELAMATEFIDGLLSDDFVPFPPATVIDIGMVRGAGWAVVESNPAWGSGIYGCDAARVLPVLQRSCIDSNKLTDEDGFWITKRDGAI